MGNPVVGVLGDGGSKRKCARVIGSREKHYCLNLNSLDVSSGALLLSSLLGIIQPVPLDCR